MKRTWRQTENGMAEITPPRVSGSPPLHNLQDDRDFTFDDIGDDGRMARHKRKLVISDSIERCESSGFNRRIIYDE